MNIYSFNILYFSLLRKRKKYFIIPLYVIVNSWQIGSYNMVPEHESKSRHEQLYELFYNKIITKEWGNGYRLQPERDLCKEYGVSRITIRETLRLLEEQGLLLRKQGKGTFICVKPVEQKLTKLYTLREQFKQAGVISEAEMLEYNVIQADLAIANHLGCQPGEDVLKIVRRFTARKTPYALETTYLPLKLFDGITQESIEKNGLYNTFFLLGVVIQRAVEQLSPRLHNKTSAQLLDSSVNDAAMFIRRTT